MMERRTHNTRFGKSEALCYRKASYELEMDCFVENIIFAPPSPSRRNVVGNGRSAKPKNYSILENAKEERRIS